MKNKRGKKKEQRKQIKQTILYSNTAIESILMLAFAPFQVGEVLGQ